MHFGFALGSSDIDLWNIDLFDTHLGLLDTDISSKHFFLSPRRLEDVFSIVNFRLPRLLQDLFKTYLQDVFITSWTTKNCYAEDVLKTSSRHVFKTSSRRLQDQKMFAGIFLSQKPSSEMIQIILCEIQWYEWTHSKSLKLNK